MVMMMMIIIIIIIICKDVDVSAATHFLSETSNWSNYLVSIDL
jgi:hypothetical protein